MSSREIVATAIAIVVSHRMTVVVAAPLLFRGMMTDANMIKVLSVTEPTVTRICAVHPSPTRAERLPRTQG
jgi:hypothetical protein